MASARNAKPHGDTAGQSPLFLLPRRSSVFLSVTRGGEVSEWTVVDERACLSITRTRCIEKEGVSPRAAVTCAESAPLGNGGVRLAIGTDGGAVQLLELGHSSGRGRDAIAVPVAKAKVDGGGLSCLAFTEDGSKLALGSESGTAALYSIVVGPGCGTELVCVWTQTSAHARRISCMSWSEVAQEEREASALLLTSGEDGLARALDASSGDEAACMKGHAGRVLACAWKSSGVALTGGEDCSLREWTLSKLQKP
jgi:WD40 repeat protein